MSNQLKSAIKAVAKQMGGKQANKSARKGGRKVNRRPQNQVPTTAPRQRVGGNLKLTTNNNANKTMPRSMMTKVVETDEYLGDVSGTTGTTLNTTAYSWNPGQSGTFAWLAKEAIQWEKWEQIGDAEVYYKREVSEYATAGTTGKVLISFDTDPHDAPPATKQEVEDTDIRTDGMPSENFGLKIPGARVNGWKPKNVRVGNLPGSADIETYDGGNLYVSTYGNAATSVMGEIRIRAKFKFSVKVLESTTTAPTQYHTSWFQSTTNEASGSTTVATQLLLATATTNALNIVNTAGSFVPPPGNYIIDVHNVFKNSTNDLEIGILDVQKNGTTLFKSTLTPQFNIINSTVQSMTLTAPIFVSCNGTDAITVVATTTYSGGSQTNQGGIRFVSV